MNHDNKGAMDAALAHAAPRLTLLTSLCGSGTCPTVYRTDKGTLLVQGYTVTPQTVGIDVPPGEQLVEIPADLLAAAMQVGA